MGTMRRARGVPNRRARSLLSASISVRVTNTAVDQNVPGANSVDMAMARPGQAWISYIEEQARAREMGPRDT